MLKVGTLRSVIASKERHIFLLTNPKNCTVQAKKSKWNQSASLAYSKNSPSWNNKTKTFIIPLCPCFPCTSFYFVWQCLLLKIDRKHNILFCVWSLDTRCPIGHRHSTQICCQLAPHLYKRILDQNHISLSRKLNQDGFWISQHQIHLSLRFSVYVMRYWNNDLSIVTWGIDCYR